MSDEFIAIVRAVSPVLYVVMAAFGVFGLVWLKPEPGSLALPFYTFLVFFAAIAGLLLLLSP